MKRARVYINEVGGGTNVQSKLSRVLQYRIDQGWAINLARGPL